MRRCFWFCCLLAGCAPVPDPSAAADVAGSAAVDDAPSSRPAAPAARVWTAGTRAVPVLMYHDVVARREVWFDLTVDEFRAQMDQLRDAGATPIRLAQLVAHLRDGRPLPAKPILLTFDQGTAGLAEHVWPLLQARGWPAVFFVHTGYVGRPSPTKEHLSWEQLRAMAATGLVDVEPMSVTFPEFLGQLDDTALQGEVAGSIEAVREAIGRPPMAFAYPYGNGDERVARALDAAGILVAFNEVRAAVCTPADRLFLPRYAPRRLDEAMAAWDRPANGAPLGPLPLTVAPPPAGLLAGWPQPAGVHRVRLGSVELPCRGVLLAGGVFTPLDDAAEMAAVGRPLLVGNQQFAMVVPYRRWMSARGHVYSPCDSLNQLVSPANYAVLGERLIAPGEPVTGPAAVVGEGLWWLPEGEATLAHRAAVALARR